MSTKPTDEEFVARVKAGLDEGTDRLDARVLSRLNQARHAALEELSPRPRTWRWVPAAAVAALAAAVVTLRLVGPGTGPGELPDWTARGADDFEIMLAEEELELVEELEFYAWLDLQGDIG